MVSIFPDCTARFDLRRLRHEMDHRCCRPAILDSVTMAGGNLPMIEYAWAWTIRAAGRIEGQ
jgi:hypothetical protein